MNARFKKPLLKAVPRSEGGTAVKRAATGDARSQKRHLYKPIPLRFSHGGSDYQQIAREGSAAIYRQRWGGCTDPSVCYEVIRIRRREGFRIHGREVEPAEVYPNSEAWGVDGWTVVARDDAFEQMRDIYR